MRRREWLCMSAGLWGVGRCGRDGEGEDDDDRVRMPLSERLGHAEHNPSKLSNTYTHMHTRMPTPCLHTSQYAKARDGQGKKHCVVAAASAIAALLHKRLQEACRHWLAQFLCVVVGGEENQCVCV